MAASVPLSVAQLEQVAGDVAQELMVFMVTENDYTDDQLPEVAQYATDITLLVINSFMSHVNQVLGAE